MIEVSNLSLHFSDQLILNNVSFTLEKGRNLGNYRRIRWR